MELAIDTFVDCDQNFELNTMPCGIFPVEGSTTIPKNVSQEHHNSQECKSRAEVKILFVLSGTHNEDQYPIWHCLVNIQIWYLEAHAWLSYEYLLVV